MSWGASSKTLPASRGRCLSCFTLRWCSLALSTVCSLGHHNVKKTLSYWRSPKGGHKDGEGTGGEVYEVWLRSLGLFMLEETEFSN